MFAKKELRIFDTNAIEKGHLITYCSVVVDWEWNEDDKEEYPVYYESSYKNGIIIKVQEDKLKVLTQENEDIVTININEVIQDSDEERAGIKILGIRENAI